MGTLADQLTKEVDKILGWAIDAKPTNTVPTPEDLTLGKTAKTFKTAVLYTDVRGSSHYGLVHQRRTVAKIFNAFLNEAVRIIRQNGGHVRSFNGDSVLAFFDPEAGSPCDDAVRSAMQLVYFQDEILQPAMQHRQWQDDFDIGIGIAYGEILATKVGVIGENQSDLIWPSTATNLAAKLGGIGRNPYHIYVAESVLKHLSSSLTVHQVETNDWWYGKRVKSVGMWSPVNDFMFAGNRLTVFSTNYHIIL